MKEGEGKTPNGVIWIGMHLLQKRAKKKKGLPKTKEVG